MKLFTKEIDKKLFANFDPLAKEEKHWDEMDVVCKIFNPYGRGYWYIISSDPNDPDYLWGIVKLYETEVGSFSRSDLEGIKFGPFKLGLERDLSFRDQNAGELYEGLLKGKHYANGGRIVSLGTEFGAGSSSDYSYSILPLSSALKVFNDGKVDVFVLYPDKKTKKIESVEELKEHSGKNKLFANFDKLYQNYEVYDKSEEGMFAQGGSVNSNEDIKKLLEALKKKLEAKYSFLTWSVDSYDTKHPFLQEGYAINFKAPKLFSQNFIVVTKITDTSEHWKRFNKGLNYFLQIYYYPIVHIYGSDDRDQNPTYTEMAEKLFSLKYLEKMIVDMDKSFTYVNKDKPKYAQGGKTPSNLKYKPGDIAYVFQYHNEQYDKSLPEKYIIRGEGDMNIQKWCKVKVLNVISDEKYFERYRVEQIDGYRPDKIFTVYQSAMADSNKKRIAIGYAQGGKIQDYTKLEGYYLHVFEPGDDEPFVKTIKSVKKSDPKFDKVTYKIDAGYPGQPDSYLEYTFTEAEMKKLLTEGVKARQFGAKEPYMFYLHDMNNNFLYDKGGEINSDSEMLAGWLPSSVVMAGYQSYCDFIWNGDDSRLNKAGTENRLQEYKQMKEDFDNKLIPPRKIIGTGYKPQYVRKIANEYLDKMIKEFTLNVNTKGTTSDINQANFKHWLRKLRDDGKVSQEKYDSLVKEMEDIVFGNGLGVFKKGGSTEAKKYVVVGYNKPGDVTGFVESSPTSLENAKRVIEGAKKVDALVGGDSKIRKAIPLSDAEKMDLVGKEYFKYASGGKLSDRTIYVPNRDIKELTIALKNELKTVSGSQVVDGVYLKKKATLSKKKDDLIEKLHGFINSDKTKSEEFKKAAIKFINTSHINKLRKDGLTDRQIIGYMVGPAFIFDIKCDAEFNNSSVEGIFDYREEFWEDNLKTATISVKEGYYEAGIKYVFDADWKKIFKENNISFDNTKKIIKVKSKSHPKYGWQEIEYETYSNGTLIFGREIGRKVYNLDGTLERETDIYEELGLEKRSKIDLNGGHYWGVVSKTSPAMDKFLESIFSQTQAYVKDCNYIYNGLGGINYKDVEGKFAKGGRISIRGNEYKDRVTKVIDGKKYEYEMVYSKLYKTFNIRITSDAGGPAEYTWSIQHLPEEMADLIMNSMDGMVHYFATGKPM